MSDSDDDFVTYGTALEPLDEETIPRKKPITIEDQFACDAQGRRRFHGAFTGGFSAGYFNTVGTRDGWRPQQFKSTRSSKADNVIQRPEDFMDDEDTGEFGIAPTAIRAAHEYSDQVHRGKKREHAKNISTGPIPGTPVLKDLLKPVRERVGVMLLKKMGWKPGQGIGPRLTKQEKKQKKKQLESVKIYGCACPPIQEDKESEDESEASDDEYANITFAPDDYEPFRCNPKDNYFGIGYSGLDRRPILGQHVNLFDAPTFSIQDKNKKLSIRGQAFGVGAFEAEDDDIYAKEDMSSYDFTLGPERKNKSRWQEVKKKSDCIEGFVPSKEEFPQKKIFAAPELPKDFQPIHKVRKSRFSPLENESNLMKKRYEMNAESRAKIINDDRPSIIESKKVEPTVSAASNMIARTLNLYGKEQIAERQKLEQITPKKSSMSWLDKLSSHTFVKGESIGSDPKITGSLQSAETLLKDSNTSTLSGQINLTKPSFPDLDKQERFEQYLKFSENERKLKFASIQPLSMTDWEREQEVEEFEKASKICERIDEISANNSKIEDKKDIDKENLDSLAPEDKMTAAAKMKMFGKHTRIEEEWKPAKLVCVRFNIAEPSGGVAEEGKKKKKFSIFDSLAWNEMSKFEKYIKPEPEPTPSTSSRYSPVDEVSDRIVENVARESPPAAKSKLADGLDKAFVDSYEKVFKTKSVTTDDTHLQETDVDTNKTKELEVRPNVQEKKDLFKSIFLSSSEDESEVDEPKTIDDEKLKVALIGKSACERNVERNNSPPRGIFAKIDLDSLMKRPDKINISKDNPSEKDNGTDKVGKRAEGDQQSSVKIKEERDTETETSELLPLDAYGPALPGMIAGPNEATVETSAVCGLSSKDADVDLNQWIEKSRDKKKSKKEKKKHKHKERSRSKSRKKSKKEKKRKV